MSKKIHMLFLILFVVLYEGVIATLSAESAKESSNFLIRKRRVVTHIPRALTPIFIEDANYMVNIRKNNNAHCAGAILSHYTVITAAFCVTLHISNYSVLSGARYENYGTNHTITSKDVHAGNPPHHQYDGIALITVDRPFQYDQRTGHINFYVGPLTAGTRAIVNGWGVSYPLRSGPSGIRRALRTIYLPIMNHRECQNAYRGLFDITDKHLCTHDEEQYCARTDAGTPLVVNYRLAGIHVYKGERRGHVNPDVFIDLQREEYSAWIRNNALLM